MPGIYLTALLTAAIAVAIFGPIIHKLRQPVEEWRLWLAFALALPLQPLAFYLVRAPLDHWLAAQLGAKSPGYQWLITLYAPLTEEPAKLVPLLVPAIFREVRRENFARFALAIGLGFALGEMGFIAHRIAQNPQFARLPFYQFGGYVGERLMTCIFHSAFVSVSLWQFRRQFALGVAGAMFLHWLGNFPISLMAWNVGGLGKTNWVIIVQLWLVLYFFVAAGILSYFAFGRVAPRFLFYSRRRCPECAGEYDAPLLALNMGPTRYERCPHCRHWHWTKAAE